MNLLSELEKFGLNQGGELNILDDNKDKPIDIKKFQKKPVTVTEQDFLLDHKVTCAVCDREFQTKKVITSKLKRLEPDDDLRPNYEHIDTIKYGVYACPHCGYAALMRDFDHLSTSQRKWIREGVCAKFKPAEEPEMKTYSYDYAVEQYKLALVSTMTKKGKLSEKAFICLNIAWLRRRQYDILPDDTAFYQRKRELVQEEYEAFYRQAFEGFQQVVSTETPPFYGMDSNTMDYMLAQMSVHYEKYDLAAKLISRLLKSPNTNRRMKDKCVDMKDKVLAAISSK
jgi:hypothetical protein